MTVAKPDITQISCLDHWHFGNTHCTPDFPPTSSMSVASTTRQKWSWLRCTGSCCSNVSLFIKSIKKVGVIRTEGKGTCEVRKTEHGCKPAVTTTFATLQRRTCIKVQTKKLEGSYVNCDATSHLREQDCKLCRHMQAACQSTDRSPDNDLVTFPSLYSCVLRGCNPRCCRYQSTEAKGSFTRSTMWSTFTAVTGMVSPDACRHLWSVACKNTQRHNMSKKRVNICLYVQTQVQTCKNVLAVRRYVLAVASAPARLRVWFRNSTPTLQCAFKLCKLPGTQGP